MNPLLCCFCFIPFTHALAAERYDRGWEAYNRQEHAKALQCFDLAIRLYPERRLAYTSRGIVYQQSGEADKAQADFAKGGRLNLGHAGWYRFAAGIHVQKGDEARAFRDLAFAFHASPRDKENFIYRGMVLVYFGKTTQAMADFDKAVELAPGDGSVLASRAWGYLQTDEYDKVIIDADAAIQLGYKDSHVYEYRGYARFSTGDPVQGLADYRKAIALNPKAPDTYHSLAWWLVYWPDDAVRDGKKAVEYAKKACELSAWKNVTYIETLAAAHAEAGAFAEAVKWQKKALEVGYGDEEKERLGRERLHAYEDGRVYEPADPS